MISRRAVRIACLTVALFRLYLPAHASEPRTLQSFGVAMQHGLPVYPLPSNVALGLYDPDPLLDLAYYANGKVQVWRNLGNGTFGDVPVWERAVNGAIEKIEFRKRRMFTETIFDPNSWGDLVITYAGGREERISHEWMMNSKSSFASLPQTTSNFPPLNFREVWKSPLNGAPAPWVCVDDIDNDGKIEVVYLFYSPWPDSINRLTVYECVSNDSFVVEWDTSTTTLSGLLDITDIDNDGHKEIVVGYFPRGINILPTVALLECHGSRSYRFYNTNIGFQRPLFDAKETDINHNGIKELTVLTSDPSVAIDPTLIYVSEFVAKSGGFMVFNQQLARYQSYAFDMAIGQVDGTGWGEIVPGNGGFGVGEPTPIHYLWYSGLPNPLTWIKRNIYTGLKSGSSVPLFTNLDADTAKELLIGGVGPILHGSTFALRYLHDTTWGIYWADSSLRTSPLTLATGMLGGVTAVAASNTYDLSPVDTFFSTMTFYRGRGAKVGDWIINRVAPRDLKLIDIDLDGKENPIFAHLSHIIGHRLAVYEYEPTLNVSDTGVEPRTYELQQNYPNPFNPATTIRFNISRVSVVQLKIFDILGKEVKTLINEQIGSGTHTLTWNGTTNEGGDANSGVYFYRLMVVGEAGTSYTDTKKMILLR